MFYSCVQSPVTVEVNTLASKNAELLGNAAGCLKAQSNPGREGGREWGKEGVCLRLPVATSCSETQECKGDRWPA